MLATLLSALLFASVADTTATSRPEQSVQLFQAVHAYVGPVGAPAEDVQMRTEWADVSGDGVADALVYLESATWCGSGGCTLLVFETITDEEEVAELGAFRPAAEISLMNGPVQVVEGADGWADLVVTTGDGTLVSLRFDGETYPSSPGAGVAVRASVSGPVLFAAAE